MKTKIYMKQRTKKTKEIKKKKSIFSSSNYIQNRNTDFGHSKSV